MKKVFASVFMSFFIMFFIWVLIGWCTIPDFMQDIQYYHLDLYGMFNRFNFSNLPSDWFIKIFTSFITSMKKINMDTPLIKAILQTFNDGGFNIGGGFSVVLVLFNALISPFNALVNIVVVLGYLIVLIVQFLTITTILATAIFDFIFSPIFIKYIPS